MLLSSKLSRRNALACGVMLGAGLDRVIADPQRAHPVALFGSAAQQLENQLWRDDRRAGAAYAGVLTGSAALLGYLLGAGSTPRRLAVSAAATWVVVGGRSLATEANTVHMYLKNNDIPAARVQLTHLVGRRTETLDEPEIARATIESVAENTCDAVVAPLFWGAVAGVPGLLAYRAVNTLDAMVGHHNPRYENFGWASARLDDVANYVPARITGVLAAVAAVSLRMDAVAALRIARRDGRRHPSPNSGVSEAAFAGALGISLGGRNDYGSHTENRPVLGSGPGPTVDDIAATTRLASRVGALAAISSAVLAWLLRRYRCVESL